MKVFLSNIPEFAIRKELRHRPAESWIYLGSDRRVLEKLKSALGGKAVQVDYGQKLYEMSYAQRNQFILWIDMISSGLASRKEWLFSTPAVKNTFTSNLFLYTCYVLILEDFIKSGKRIDLVFVDSPALAVVLKDSFHPQVEYPGFNAWLKIDLNTGVFIKAVLRFGKYFLDFARRLLAAKIILKGRRRTLLQGKGNIVLIRNFITGEFSDTRDDIIERHFFPGLYDYLKEKGSEPVFLPIITQTSQYEKLFRSVLNSRKLILFPEEFLGWGDFIHTFCTPFAAAGLKISPPLYGRHDLGRILREEYRANLTEFGFLYATLLSHCGRRLKECGLTLRGMVNWTENQAFEKGLLLGLRESFPGLHVIGSQPFVFPSNYLPPVFTRQEKEFGLLPDKVLVLGPLAENSTREFIKDLKIDYSPAFRYAFAFSGRSAAPRGKSLLVLLSYDLYNSLNIMRTLLEIDQHLKSFDRVLVKLHPAGYFNDKKLVKALGRELPENYQFIGGRLEECLSQVAVGVCGASGTAVELVMSGIPVITIGETHTLTMDYVACKQDRDMWQLCFSKEQVVEALEHFETFQKEHSSADRLAKVSEFRNAFFAQPDERYWENYLIQT